MVKPGCFYSEFRSSQERKPSAQYPPAEGWGANSQLLLTRSGWTSRRMVLELGKQEWWQ